ncbi:MAG: LptF/LptG family permease [Bacteroidota bacterium]
MNILSDFWPIPFKAQHTMKQIDKLVINAFLRLFALIFCVGLFVLLMQFFLIYFRELIGKGLGWSIYAQLASYFTVIAIKQAFPLASLVASMMAMGGLGEHHELTALKSAGISLPRVLLPSFGVVFLFSILAFFSNSYVAPYAQSSAFDLLYDLPQKKPSLAIKEGAFYDGLPGYSIKIRKKLDDKKSLQGIMIYDHTQNRGNVSLTMAESGELYTIHDESYLVLELFDGHNYVEEPAPASTPEGPERAVPPFYRSSFKAQKLIFDLDSFKMKRKKGQFSHHRMAKNARQLAADVRVMKGAIQVAQQSLQAKALRDMATPKSTEAAAQVVLPAAANILQFKAYVEQSQDQSQTSNSSPGLYKATDLAHIYGEALEQARELRSEVALQKGKQKRLEGEIRKYELERYQMMAWAVTCLVAFLIGAPLGAIIKKGGLGIPLLISTILIVGHYILEMLGEKWAIAGMIDTFSGAWLANGFLLPFGLFFLIQAYRDARLLEADFYMVMFGRIKKQLSKARRLLSRPRN